MTGGFILIMTPTNYQISIALRALTFILRADLARCDCSAFHA